MPEICMSITGTPMRRRTRLRRYSPSEEPCHSKERGKEGRISTHFKLWVCLCIVMSEQKASPSPPFNTLRFCIAFPSSLLLPLGRWVTLMLLFYQTRTLLLLSLHKNGSTHVLEKSAFLFPQFLYFFHSLTSPNWSFERLDRGKRKIWKEYLNIVLSLAGRWRESWGELVMREGSGKEKPE